MCVSKQACRTGEMTALLPVSGSSWKYKVSTHRKQHTGFINAYIQYTRALWEEAVRLPRGVTYELAAAICIITVGPCRYLKIPGGKFVRRYTAVITLE